uniref:Right handed beta helix domain-containing protein n=1 Tax=Amphimedon queenslandica TaxID=400682 RepID=A0A1X7SHG5_AMPQE
MNSNVISLSNVTVANSTSTGLTLQRSLVIIKNSLVFKNNTGVVGGGLAINDSSQLRVSSSANLEFINNHASYKGGGIYVEESSKSGIVLLVTPKTPLTLINNTAGLVGGDMYGVYSYQFNLTNPHISSTGNPVSLCFCNPHAINITKSCFYVSKQYIYPGQALQYYVALFGNDYLRSLTPTDGIVQ